MPMKKTFTALATGLALTFGGITLGAAPATAASTPVVTQAHTAGHVGWSWETKTKSVRTGKVGIWGVYKVTTYKKFKTSLTGSIWLPVHERTEYRAFQ